MGGVRVLHVAGYGVRLGARGWSLVVEGPEGRSTVPLSEVDVVVVATSGVSISSSALRRMLRAGVELVVLDSRGDPVGLLYSSHYTRTPATRRAQYEAYRDWRGLMVVEEVASAKIESQACHLEHLALRTGERWLSREAERLRAKAEEAVEAVRGAGGVEEARRRAMRVEAEAARRYWGSLASIMPRELGFEGRSQEAPDPFNAALNYGYGILYSLAWRALVLAGLDPYAGFLHVDRSGKPVLAFDYVEVFRVAAVDAPLVEAVLRGWRPRFDGAQGRLSPGDRERVAVEVKERLSRAARGAYRSMSLEEAVRSYALNLASALRDGRRWSAYRGC
ncbi:MAG: CRISPR-associated endonuclease Cas1 [Desulfurococcales archaeon]|nr:CRISPR-associated endonuclease Cas1 [Desulfurococcales archaeon]